MVPDDKPEEDYGDEAEDYGGEATPAESGDDGEGAMDYGGEASPAAPAEDYGDGPAAAVPAAPAGPAAAAVDYGDSLAQGVTYSETTTQSWGSRISDSIKGVVVGVVLFIGAFPLLFWNEGRAVQTAKSLAEGKGAVVAAASDKVDPANDQKLVHVSAEATTQDKLADAEFGVSATAIKLRRKVEMYQWKENKTTKKRKRVGGSEETTTTYSYEKVWSDKVIDSSNFNQKAAEKRHNPATMPYQSKELVAKNVALGAFKLSPSLIAQIDKAEDLAAGAETLPAELKATAKPVGGGYYIGPGQPSEPRISDLKITFQVVPSQVVSVVAQQAGDSFQPYQTDAGDALDMLAVGQKSAKQMFAAAEASNRMMTWILRLVGFIIMAAGIGMVFGPLATLADVLPILGDILRLGIGLFAVVVALVLSLITIAIAWLFYRPVLGVILLAAAGGLFYFVKQRGKARKAAAAPAAAPASGGV